MSPQPIEQGTSDAIDAGAGESPQAATLMRTIFGRHLMDMAVLLVIIVAFSGLRAPEHLMSDPDIWWHLADARILTTTHHFIRVEPYSYSVAGQRWVNPEWLSEMPYWLGYRTFGLVGIYLVALLGLCANVYFLYWRTRLKPANIGVALWMAALGFILMWVNAAARTIVIAYIALSAEMAILEAVERGRKKLLWLLPPLFCVWINLHGSWIIGLAIFVLYIGCGLFRANVGVFQQEPFSTSDRNRLLGVLSASVVALFINPYGWRLLWNPIDMAVNQKLNIGWVIEWQPLNLGWFVGKAAVLSIALMVIANALNGRKWKIYEFALVFFAWYAAFNHARFTFLAAILTVPMLGADLTRCFFPITRQKTIPAMNALIAAGTVGVIAWYFPTSAQMQKGLETDMPLQLIGSVQPGWRTLNQEHLGGIMDFMGKSTFVDTRWDTFEHHGIMQDFIDMLHSHDSLNLLDKYKIDHVLLRREEQLIYLLERTPGWKVVRQEGSGHDAYELMERVNGNSMTPAGCAPPTAQLHP
jgi:hypothetical protein